MRIFGMLWRDEGGFVVSSELVLIASIAVIGLIAGLATVRDQVVSELADVANAIGNMMRGNTPSGQQTASSELGGNDPLIVLDDLSDGDLDKAAENWKRLGFTVSPRGTHSAKMGSGNYTIMFDPDYMELLGVLVETEHNIPTRAFLGKRGEGIERIAFTAVDSAAGAEEIRGRGYAALGPTDFERPVTMPDGTQSAAKFRIFQWPIEQAPAGLRIFACQHKTRETVWIAELQKHANTAKAIARIFRPPALSSTARTWRPTSGQSSRSWVVNRPARRPSSMSWFT